MQDFFLNLYNSFRQLGWAWECVTTTAMGQGVAWKTGREGTHWREEFDLS